MYIDEFLIKIGVDATQAGKINDVINKLSKGANKLGENANEIANNIKKSVDNVADGTGKLEGSVDKAETKTSKLKLGLLALVTASVFIGKSLVSAFNGAIDKATELYTKKDALFRISKQELAQAKQYKDAMSKAGLAIDSVKTKIALNLAPSITNIINSFNKWMVANKDLIVNGIGSAIKIIGKCFQVITNFFRLIDKVISSTIGWKNALGVLAIAWAVFNRALLFSPIGIVIALITGLLLLIDDLMVYMDGGDSLFGEYWQPLIDGAKAVWAVIKKLYEYLKPIFMLIKSIWTGDIDGIVRYAKESVTSINKAFEDAFNAITGFAAKAVKNILMYFGMSESGATRVVNSIGTIFSAITDFITAPFKAGWTLITSLFDIWGDDSLTFTDKLGKTFDAITDFLLSPFKAGWEFVKKLLAMCGVDVDKVMSDMGKSFLSITDSIIAPFKGAISWIKDKFFGFISTIKEKLSFLSYIGIDIGGDEVSTSNQESANLAMEMLNKSLKSMDNTNMPISKNAVASTKNNTVNQSMNNTININTSDTSVGIDKTVDMLSSQLKSTMDNAKTGMGTN